MSGKPDLTREGGTDGNAKQLQSFSVSEVKPSPMLVIESVSAHKDDMLQDIAQCFNDPSGMKDIDKGETKSPDRNAATNLAGALGEACINRDPGGHNKAHRAKGGMFQESPVPELLADTHTQTDAHKQSV